MQYLILQLTSRLTHVFIQAPSKAQSVLQTLLRAEPEGRSLSVFSSVK